MTDPIIREAAQPEGEFVRQRERSTIAFPYGGLGDGIEVANAIRELGDSCEHEQLVPSLGYSTVDNGAYRQKVATARHFGLIEVSKERVILTPLGHKLTDPAQAPAARASAFLNVPLYRTLYERYKGNLLPPTSISLEAVLVSLGVAAKQKDKARQALMRSADEAGFFSHGRDRLVAPASDATRPHPKEKVPDGGQGGQGPPEQPTLIKGLIEKLPREGSVWSDTEQKQWLDTAKMIFSLIYKTERLALPAGNSADHRPSGGPSE